ncbi:MAG: acetyl-CoA decarbonylase/synthase complex subunit delta [Phycisphaerae bacterium]|jgi:acetyl-CoA decarbonylase/synthase complex subunit delta|nr:acetyl-CoA decarbonylase/synthase complex subunit delta [Phycisphaerae bacterium]
MEVADITEKWTNRIRTVTIGATPEEGGTRGGTVTVGGETTLPFLMFEGEIPNRPIVAGMIADVVPDGWPEVLKNAIGDVINSPAEWAQKCVEEFKVDVISLKLIGADPAGANRSAAEVAETVKAVLEATDVPLIFWGCGDEEKDNEVLMECSHAAKGERCLIGSATETNYRTLGAIGTADKHKVIAEAPVDINIGKQVNILLQDAGFSLNDVVMCQTTAALGYGFDYVYTIFERVRIAGLKGDDLMALPQIANVAWEVWKVKEAIQDEDILTGWGSLAQRGPLWETTTAIGYLHAGADILTLAHPQSIAAVRLAIDEMMTE